MINDEFTENLLSKIENPQLREWLALKIKSDFHTASMIGILNDHIQEIYIEAISVFKDPSPEELAENIGKFFEFLNKKKQEYGELLEKHDRFSTDLQQEFAALKGSVH